MLLTCKCESLEETDTLYGRGDASDVFYFVLAGQLQLMVIEQDEMKFSKTVDLSTFFGFRDSPDQKRNDFASATQGKTELITFNTAAYKEIITKTMQSESEAKIDFLMRFGPKLREAGRRLIEEFEVFFVKEKATKGFQLTT